MKGVISEHSCGQVMTDGSSSGLGAERGEGTNKIKDHGYSRRHTYNYTAVLQ